MQGVSGHISTEDKVEYLSALLHVGFDVLDAGSFVSPKAVPQMADTARVLDALPESETEILAIVANLRGAKDALSHGRADWLGFPFSLSEVFQRRNTGAGMEEGWARLQDIFGAVDAEGKRLVVYLSMGFGNPYGDLWSPDMVVEWSGKIQEAFKGVRIALSDTVGHASPELVHQVFTSAMAASSPSVMGAHLHGRPEAAKALMKAAWDAGCRSFDGALGGHGGCPMAKDELVGNLPTEVLMQGPEEWSAPPRDWNLEALAQAQRIRLRIFEGKAA